MNDLTLYPLGSINKFISSVEYEELLTKTLALEFFTDFMLTAPLIIESSMSAMDTMRLMKKAHVRLKLILNDNDELIGIVSANDLLERKIIQKLEKGDSRQDLIITDFMTPVEKLRVLEFSEVTKSNIEQVIEVLKLSGQQHCLVVDSDVGLIRGLFSVNDISRKLKIDIDIYEQPSFSKLAAKLD